jgi:DNA (cytosine-5)-methyltransferase 1
MTFPVIDLFAGPGGLGEGFSRSRVARFQTAVSIEKDRQAFETLRLRAAHRAVLRTCGTDPSIWDAWDRMAVESTWQSLFRALSTSRVNAIRDACKEAASEAWCLELGSGARSTASEGILVRMKRLGFLARGHAHNTVLIGGPPCQAYSVAGRSRNRGNAGYRPEKDHRHFLYKEYLQVISEFRPAVFVMENVKGILTSKVEGNAIFDGILEDLHRPDLATGAGRHLEYELVPLAGMRVPETGANPIDYLVKAEEHGIPQARHRVILLGIRSDVLRDAGEIPSLRRTPAPTVASCIGDLPKLLPSLSRRGAGLGLSDVMDSPELRAAVEELRQRGTPVDERVATEMEHSSRQVSSKRELHGSSGRRMHSSMEQWFHDRPIHLPSNHETRSHMPADLLRYLFVASHGKITGRSAKLADFPICLLPEHRNVDREDPGSSIFKDRFRVQVKDKPATTVTSHIAKDGHAFIHPDPSQCRSLTVREAARLQTFPDSYLFLGNRTSQYTQVGNAVPPALAVQIADVVGEILIRAGLDEAT